MIPSYSTPIELMLYFRRESKIEGLVLIRRLARHHTEFLLPQVKQVTAAVIAEVRYLVCI